MESSCKMDGSARRRQQAAHLNAGSGVVMLPNLFNQRKMNESHMMASVELQPVTKIDAN